MSVEEYHGLELPNSPSDRQKLKQHIDEVVNCLTRMQAEREAKKAITDQIKEEFGIPPKLINKAASTIYKANFQQVSAENDDLDTLLDTLKYKTDVSNYSDTDDGEYGE